MSETIYLCGACGTQIDPSESGVVRAFRIHEVGTFGKTSEVEGLADYFHEDCWGTGIPGYKLAP